jgi:RHS repeat-associated protein
MNATHSSGAKITYVKLNNPNRLTNLVWGTSSASLASFAYKLMSGGTRTNLIETKNNLPWATYQWSFDNLYRLTNENVSTFGNVAYAYDPAGNRTNQISSISGLPTDSYTYDTNDEVSSDNNDNNPDYEHDSCMTTWGGYSWQGSGFPYDYLDRMAYGANPNDFCKYWYDGDDNLIQRQVDNGNSILKVIDDLNPSGYPQVLEEFTTASDGILSGYLTRVYNYGSSLIGQQQFDPNSHLPSTLSYYGYDGHGNVRFLADTNGLITDTYTYDAFGNLIYPTGSTTNDYLYCGLQYDWVSGLYNNRARRMFAPLGIFTTRDGDYGNNEDPLSSHKYLYAENDPINNVDPSGHDIFDVLLSVANCLAGLRETFSLTECIDGTTSSAGPDVTAALDGTLEDVNTTFSQTWNPPQKQ